MKKRFIYLFVLLISTFAIACSDDDDKNERPVPPDVPPTVNEVAKTYSGEQLKALIDGKEAAANASVDVVVAEDKSVSLRLNNMVPDIKTYSVPATFATHTKSAYVSTLKGAVTDDVLGYTISAEGTVENDLMDITVNISELSGDPVNVKGLIGTYKGDMTIDVYEAPSVAEQRIYISKSTNRDTSAIKLDITNFSFGAIKLGDISLDSVPVVKREGIYGIQAEGYELSLPVIGNVKINARGGIIEEADGTLNLKLNLYIDASGLGVYVAFDGNYEQESTDTQIGLSFKEEAVALQPDNSNANTVFSFKVWASATDLMLTPVVTLPAGAVLDSIVAKYDDGSQEMMKEVKALDFSKLNKSNAVTFYVTAEDVRVHRAYFLTLDGKVDVVTPVYTMQEWVTVSSTMSDEITFNLPKGLSSSNDAAITLAMFELPMEPFFVTKDNESAKIITRNTFITAYAQGMVPPVTAGTMFNGSFSITDIMNPLTSTRFGEAYNKKPAKFKFSYKYVPGSTYYVTSKDADECFVQTENAELKDECAISAYLYEVNSYGESLDGSNINTSDKVILKAVFNGGLQESFVEKEISFESTGKAAYDPAKKYKLAIVCTSSKDGDKYNGAPDSALWIKHLEVVSE